MACGRADLENQGLAIADRQEGSAASRRQIATDTRNFRKSLADGAAISSIPAVQPDVDERFGRLRMAPLFLGLAPELAQELS